MIGQHTELKTQKIDSLHFSRKLIDCRPGNQGGIPPLVHPGRHTTRLTERIFARRFSKVEENGAKNSLSRAREKKHVVFGRIWTQNVHGNR